MTQPRWKRSKVARAYAAGLLDGEGTVWINHKSNGQWQQTVSINSTDPRLIHWLLQHFHGYMTIRTHQNDRHKASLDWHPDARDIVLFLRAVQPYVVIKREHVEIALAFRALGMGKRVSPEKSVSRELLRARLRVLTKRGVPG